MACTCGGHATPETVEVLPPGTYPDSTKRYIPSPCADCAVVMLAARGAETHALVLLPDPEEG